MRTRYSRRLDALTGGALEAAYRRIAALWAEGGTEQNQAEVLRLFCWVATAEAERGTPAEVILERLPRGMAQGIREALARLLGVDR